MAEAQGVSRMRIIAWVVAQQGAHAARAHVVRHARARGFAKEDHRQAATAWPTRFMWPILRPLVAADDAPITVKSLATTAHSRPSILPKPATLPSAGDLSGSASPSAEQAGLDKGAGIEEILDPLAGIEHAGGLAAAPASRVRPWRAPWPLFGSLMTPTSPCRDDALLPAHRCARLPCRAPRAARRAKSWPMSRPAWRTPPGVSDRRGTTVGMATEPRCWSGASYDRAGVRDSGGR